MAKTLLHAWMEETGTKDDALAAQVGVSRVQITRLRNGGHRPSLRTALRLAEITKIDAGRLMTDQPTGEAA